MLELLLLGVVENVDGTLTKKLILRFRFFIELKSDFVVDVVVVDSGEEVGGWGAPMTEIPPFLPKDPPKVPAGEGWKAEMVLFPVSGCPDRSDNSVFGFLKM